MTAKFDVLALGLVLFGVLVSCGGNGGEVEEMPSVNGTGNEFEESNPDPEPPEVVIPTTPDVSNPVSGNELMVYSELGFPYIFNRGYYGIGGDGLAQDASGLSAIGSKSGITLAYGNSSDGIGRNTLIAELAEDAREYKFLIRWEEPPVIRFKEGTSQELISLTHNVVAMINTALPPDWQLSIDFESVPEPPEQNGIFISFVPRHEWPEDLPYEPSHIGIATVYYTPEGEIIYSPIWIDTVRSASTGSLIRTIGHELLHALGRGHPVDLDRPDTIMSYSYASLPHILYPMDQEMLLAVYSRLESGTELDAIAIGADLGPWDDNALHILGEIDIDSGSGILASGEGLLFGVRSMNGRQMPWVYGSLPRTVVANNRGLLGSASWTGAVIGFTRAEEAVHGGAHLAVDFASLDGNLRLDELEYWASDTMPSGPGTGTMWRDGDLQYSVQLTGNAFGNYRPGANDDAGIVDGGFFGRQHEAMGGVVERVDLTAAFGGTR